MHSFRVGLNKGFAIAMLALAGFQLFVYAIVHSPLQLALGFMWILVGVLYLLGPCFVVEQSSDASDGGEVLVKNPLGMTLKRHAFGRMSDLSVEGRKLAVKKLDGTTKWLGGLLVDGSDMAKLADWLGSAPARGQGHHA